MKQKILKITAIARSKEVFAQRSIRKRRKFCSNLNIKYIIDNK